MRPPTRRTLFRSAPETRSPESAANRRERDHAVIGLGLMLVVKREAALNTGAKGEEEFGLRGCSGVSSGVGIGQMLPAKWVSGRGF